MHRRAAVLAEDLLKDAWILSRALLLVLVREVHLIGVVVNVLNAWRSQVIPRLRLLPTRVQLLPFFFYLEFLVLLHELLALRWDLQDVALELILLLLEM